MERKVINREKCGNYIMSLGNGTSFGELALINKDCIRNATIISDCTTHLVVVNRMTYNRSLKEVHEADFKKRIDFVNKCSIFNGWIQSLKKQAAMSLVQTDFQFEADLIRQGEPLNGLLFILTGQAQIFVDVLKHPKQYPSLKLATDPSNFQPTDEHKLIHTESPNYPIRRMGYVINEHRNALRRIELSLVGPGTILGEFEYGFDLKTYMQTAICTESITAYVLSSRNFDRLIQSRRNPDGLKKIKMMAERNLMLRIKRQIDSKIPLFICLAQDIMERNLLLQEEQRDKVLFSKSKINQQQRPNDKIKSQLKQEELESKTRRQKISKLQKDMLTLRSAKYSDNQEEEEIMNNRRNPLKKRITSTYSRTETISSKDSTRFTKSEADTANFTSGNERSTNFCLYDWETCSENISQIERKLRRWHYGVDMLYEGKTSVTNRISSLKSCEEINTSKHLIPGKQILIKTPNMNTLSTRKPSEVDQIPTEDTTNDICKSVRFESNKRKNDVNEVLSSQNDEVKNNEQSIQMEMSIQDNCDDTTNEEHQLNDDAKDNDKTVLNASQKLEKMTNELKLILGRIRPVSSSYGYVLTSRSTIASRNAKSARMDENKGDETRRSTVGTLSGKRIFKTKGS
uniref:Cyclic nucleotide-binding domain-containing protein n=1 Tax=Trichobilharzia regenti TaxID=157069 RepID=A0AA85K9E0_TRIRE|nr:unnamed protein product [Trichobilharzia regenti]